MNIKSLYVKNSVVPVHLLLAVLFVLLPFIFTPTLLETETTIRFFIAGILLSALSLLSFWGGASQFRFSKLSILLLAFITYATVSLFFTINRGEGLYDLLKWWCYFGFFAAFSSLFSRFPNAVLRLTQYANFAVLAFTLIALASLGNSLAGSKTLQLNYQVASSLGNKNFYAETLLLLLPLLVLGYSLQSAGWRYFTGFNIAVVVGSLVVLQCFSTWVAIAVLLLLTVIAIGGSPALQSRIRKHNSLSKMATLLLVGGLILIFGWVQFGNGKFMHIRSRIENIRNYSTQKTDFSKEDIRRQNSVAERLFLWKNAISAWRDHPILGVGFDNWKVLSGKYGWPFAFTPLVTNIRYVRPHNDWLLLLAELGIVGFALFAGIFVYAAKLAITLVRRPLSGYQKKIIISAATGILLYGLIAFFSLPGDRFYPLLLLFIYFALLQFGNQTATSSEKKGGEAKWLLTGLLVAGLALSAVSVLRLRAESHLMSALRYQYLRNWTQMSFHASKANTFLFPLDFTGTPISWYQGMAAFRSQTPGIAKYYYEDALHHSPYHLQVLNDLGSAYAHSGNTTQALQCYNRALEIAPFYPEPFFNKIALTYNRLHPESSFALLDTYARPGDAFYLNMLTAILTDQVLYLSHQSESGALLLKKGNANLLKVYSEARQKQIPITVAIQNQLQPK